MSSDPEKESSSPCTSEYDDPNYVELPLEGHQWQKSNDRGKTILRPAQSDINQFERASNTSKQEAALGVDHRLVPDLMQVYENMAVSKTPHTRSSVTGLSGQPDVAAMHASSQSYQGPSHQWSYGNFSIPAPYPVPYTSNGKSPVDTEAPHPSDAEPSITSSTDQRQSRKRSKDGSSYGSTKRRKKSGKDKEEEGKTQDGRWTKRFTWPEELHRDFVASVFDIGLKHATPSSVMENMPSHQQITTERIKSHLQKYRLHRHKSKEEFMSCYDDMVHRLKKHGARGVASLSGGHVAGYVSYAVETQPDPEATADDAAKPKSTIANPLSQTEGVQDGDTILTIPRLTEDEKNSSLGMSLGYLLGLFFSLKRQLQEKRQNIRPPYSDTTHDSSLLLQGSTGRNTLEAGSLMKREMESQMAFQNKMRALKQEELSKLAEIPGNADGTPKTPAFPDAPSPTDTIQHPGEADETRPATKPRTTSEEEDFWNATNFDGELFDFLME